MTTSTVDPYDLQPDTDPIEDKFRDSLVQRAKKRTVVFNAPDGEFSVSGNESLGDSRSRYTVRWDGATRRWVCDCYSTHHGQTRRRSICSHALAVILHRRNPPTAASSRPAPKSPIKGRTVDRLPPPGLAGPASVVDGTVTKIPSPLDPRFGKPAIPSQFRSIHPHQWDAVEEIVEAFKTKRLVFLDAPTGSGKTIIAELTRRLVSPDAIYCCSGLQLQSQFLADFDYSRVIRGRSNYATSDGPDYVTCADCTASPPSEPNCYWCPEIDLCPYRLAKASAAKADLAVLNTSYFLHAANHAGDFSGRDLVILDEADTLESALMSFVEVTISKRLMDDLALGQPRYVTKPESWHEWLTVTVIPKITKAIAQSPPDSPDVSEIRRRKNLQQTVEKLKKVAAGVLDGNWVFDDYAQGKATFRPIRVDEFGQANLWKHGQRFLLMSATIISAELMAENLGWEEDFAVVKVPMTFPVENRPIHVASVANMTNKQKETEWPKMGLALANLLDRHKDERVLVHTVSYGLMTYLADELTAYGLGDRVLTYQSAGQRDAVVGRFKKKKAGVLIAPSLDRGLDLPDDLCSVVVICKVPFASLGDKQVAARMHSKGGNSWYAVETVRGLVQMAGRHVRHAKDRGKTYILDGQFESNIWSKSRLLLPEWWREALDWRMPKQPLMVPRVKHRLPS